MGKLETSFPQQKCFWICWETFFASRVANFVSATNFSEVGKQGNIDRKHSVSATIFPSLPKALLWVYFHTGQPEKHAWTRGEGESANWATRSGGFKTSSMWYLMTESSSLDISVISGVNLSSISSYCLVCTLASTGSILYSGSMPAFDWI